MPTVFGVTLYGMGSVGYNFASSGAPELLGSPLPDGSVGPGAGVLDPSPVELVEGSVLSVGPAVLDGVVLDGVVLGGVALGGVVLGHVVLDGAVLGSDDALVDAVEGAGVAVVATDPSTETPATVLPQAAVTMARTPVATASRIRVRVPTALGGRLAAVRARWPR